MENKDECCGNRKRKRVNHWFGIVSNKASDVIENFPVYTMRAKRLFRLQIVLIAVTLFQSIQSVSSDSKKTNVLHDFGLSDEATLADSELIYRLSIMPLIGSSAETMKVPEVIHSIKIAVLGKELQENFGPYNAEITFKALESKGGIFERKRKLTSDEVVKFVQLLYDQEVFSLPEKKEMFSDLAGVDSAMGDPIFKLERYDKRTGTTTAVERSFNTSSPFKKAGEYMYGLISPWLSEFRTKEEAGRK